MIKPLSLLTIAVITFIGASANARAADTACAALREKSSYKGDLEEMMYLLPGKDGWFFRTQQDLKTEYRFRHENGTLIAKLSKILKDKNIDLIIAYPPTRGVVAHQFAPISDTLAKGYNPAMVRRNYIKMLDEMKADGVNMVGEPDVKIGSKYFFKADHHWTPDGASEMAQDVAAFAKTLPVYSALKKTEFVTTDLPAASTEPTFGAAIKKICGASVAPDNIITTQTAPAAKGDADSLLGDAAATEVVLVGTSNSKREVNDLNFSGLLKEFLSVDVLNAAISGGGIAEAMSNYLASNHIKDTPPKILIWEIPGYYDLDGGVFRGNLRQLIASVYRACDKPLVRIKGAKLGAADIFQGKGKDIAPGTPFYFGMTPAQKMSKKFTLTFNFDKGQPEKYEVSQLRSYPDDMSFYYAPKVPSGARLLSVAVDGGAGAVADVSLCEFPTAP